MFGQDGQQRGGFGFGGGGFGAQSSSDVKWGSKGMLCSASQPVSQSHSIGRDLQQLRDAMQVAGGRGAALSTRGAAGRVEACQDKAQLAAQQEEGEEGLGWQQQGEGGAGDGFGFDSGTADMEAEEVDMYDQEAEDEEAAVPDHDEGQQQDYYNGQEDDETAADADYDADEQYEGGADGLPSTPYDLLAARPGAAARSAPGPRSALAADEHLVVEPQCSDMCPQAERDGRTTDKQLHELERLPSEEYATDASLAVKKYRSIRKDVTQTGLQNKGNAQLAWINTAAKEAKSAAAEKKKQRKATPRITFDVDQYEADAVAAAQGALGSFQPDPYDGHLNHQELTKTLLDLSALYRDARRQGVVCPCEGEFMAYYLLLSSGTFGAFKQLLHEDVALATVNGVAQGVVVSPHVQFALAMGSALRSGHYVKMFELLEAAPLMLAAAAQVFVPVVRTRALCLLFYTATPPSRDGLARLPLARYSQLLRFDSPGQAAAFVMRHKGKRARPGGFEAALADLTPLPVEHIVAAAISGSSSSMGPHQPACRVDGQPLLLPCSFNSSEGSSTGVKQQLLQVEVLDLVAGQLGQAAAQQGSSSTSCGRGLCGGAAAVLLLVSGPDEEELLAAVGRLGVVLEQLAPAPAVPLVVLACSGELS
eukprot:gene4946-5187_t